MNITGNKEESIVDMDIIKEEYSQDQAMETEASTESHPEREKTQFSCSECGKKYSTKWILITHKQMMHNIIPRDSNDQPFKCPKCARTFKGKMHLGNHLTTHGYVSSRQRLKTARRSRKLWKKLKYEQQKAKLIRSESPTSEQTEEPLEKKEPTCHFDYLTLTCGFCGRTLKNKSHFLTHMKTHHDQKFECKECGKEFSQKGLFEAHLLTHTTAAAESLGLDGDCEVKRYLRVYLERLNEDQIATMTANGGDLNINQKQRKDCKEAGKKYKSKPRIPVERFKCDTCGKDITNESLSQRHQVTHELKCSLCLKVFKRSANLKEHTKNKKYHTNKYRFECHKCGKKYSYNQALQNHIMKFHLRLSYYEITGQRNACEICGKEFYNKHKLKDHMVAHSTIKAFKCHICDGDFKYRRCLDRHIKWHEENGRKRPRKKVNSTNIRENPQTESVKATIAVPLDSTSKTIESSFALESTVKVEEYIIDE